MMKFAFTALLITLFATFTIATISPQHSVIVSYPDNTPDSVLDEAKYAIKAAGGMVTHEFKLIKAFAAKASEATLNSVKTLGAKYNAVIEEDAPVTILGTGTTWKG